ncbi:MAG: CcrColossus [Caulobacter sp.]|nr:CcrColossus [Caulobacter sp.]
MTQPSPKGNNSNIMPDRQRDCANFLSALLSRCHDNPASFVVGDDEHPVTSAQDIENLIAKAGDEPIYARPTTSDGKVAFLHSVIDNSLIDEWASLVLKPTVVMFKDGITICAYALENPVAADDQEEVVALYAAMGGDLEDMIPTPGANGWEMVLCDPDAYQPLSALVDAYMEDAPVIEASPVAQVQAPAEDAPPWIEEDFGTLLDARVLAPIDLDASEYQQEMVISIGANFKSVKWRPDRMTIAKFITLMAKHPEGKQKDGPGFVLAEIAGDNRRKQAVKACFGIGLDIDVGMPGAEIDEALGKLGCLAVRYTTFSHGKKVSQFNKDKIVKFCDAEGIDFGPEAVIRFLREKSRWHDAVLSTAEYIGDEHEATGLMACISHAPMQKHRIVMPLAVAFDPTKVAKTHALGMAKWAEVCKALARLLGDLPMDNSATDPSRLFYFPRHLKGRPHDTTVFGGPLFDWNDLALDGGGAASGVKASATAADEQKAGIAPLTTRWAGKRADGLQIADLLRAECEERVRQDNTSKITIDCPFDEDHSNPGDPNDAGCFAVNAGEGGNTRFVIKCSHDACHGRDNLTMINRMLADGWFEKSVITDETYDIKRDEESGGGEPVRQTEQALAPESNSYPLPGHLGKFTTVKRGSRTYLARKGEDGPEILCSRFTIAGAARYADKGDLRDIELEIENEVSERETVRIPADLIANKSGLIALMRGRSMGFATAEAERWFHRVLMSEAPKPRTLFDRAGWREDNAVYISASGSVLRGDVAKFGLSEAGLGPNVGTTTQGSFEGWKTGAAAICRQHSASMKAALFIGFVGVILALAGEAPAVYLFTGRTSGGKSWRQEIGVAVSGTPVAGEGQMRSMKTTANGLEYPLMRASAGILALDEMKGQLAEFIQDLIFMIYGRTGKSRMTAAITEQKLAKWTGMAVTMSTEVGLAQQLQQSKALRAGGLSVRMIQIPVSDTDYAPLDQFKVYDLARQNFGWGLPPFIAELARQGYIAEPRRLRDAAERIVDKLAGVDDPVARRAAFALAYMELAAWIAIDAGLFPDDTDVQPVVDELWGNYLASDMAPADPTNRAIETLIQFLQAHRDVDVIALGDTPRGPTKAWIMPRDSKKCGPTDPRVYVIPVANVGEMAGGAVSVDDLKKALDAQGYLVRSAVSDKSRLTWRHFPNIGTGAFLVLAAERVEDAPEISDTVTPENECVSDSVTA